jgi:hypothetical protein
MTSKPTRYHSFATLLWAPLIALALFALPALAQDPVVNSADPPSAEQETLDLDVMVGGDNFGTDSTVRFLVTGSQNPGGIHVKNVKRQGPKTLKVTIDIDADAVVDDFDIEVMSRGRTGKGIELFRVREKTNQSPDMEFIAFSGDFLGGEVVEGCCPNAGPFPAYQMTVTRDLGNPDGLQVVADTYSGFLFMNRYGRGRNAEYLVQFWGVSQSDNYITVEIIGGVIDDDKKTKVTTVTFESEVVHLETKDYIDTVSFTLVRTRL